MKLLKLEIYISDEDEGTPSKLRQLNYGFCLITIIHKSNMNLFLLHDTICNMTCFNEKIWKSIANEFGDSVQLNLSLVRNGNCHFYRN